MNLTATDRKTLIRLASSMEKGSDERKAILAGLGKTAGRGVQDKFPAKLEIYHGRNFGNSFWEYDGTLSVQTGNAWHTAQVTLTYDWDVHSQRRGTGVEKMSEPKDPVLNAMVSYMLEDALDIGGWCEKAGHYDCS